MTHDSHLCGELGVFAEEVIPYENNQEEERPIDRALDSSGGPGPPTPNCLGHKAPTVASEISTLQWLISPVGARLMGRGGILPGHPTGHNPILTK